MIAAVNYALHWLEVSFNAASGNSSWIVTILPDMKPHDCNYLRTTLWAVFEDMFTFFWSVHNNHFALLISVNFLLNNGCRQWKKAQKYSDTW